MIPFRWSLFPFILSFLVFGPAAVSAQDAKQDAFAGAVSASSHTQPRESIPAKGEWGVSEQTGAATFTYPIEVPPGRNGMEPELALRYSSRGPLRGGIAVGWSLNVPEIRLQRPAGEDGGEPIYRASLRGISGRLIEVPDRPPFSTGGTRVETYRVEHDGSFTRFVRSESPFAVTWTALTSDGVRHHFESANLPSTFGHTRFHLTTQRDPHGNEVRYFWKPIFEGGGEDGEIVDVVLDRIEYTSNQTPELEQDDLDPHARIELGYRGRWETCFGSELPIGAALDNALGTDRPGYVEGSRPLGGITISVREDQDGEWIFKRDISLVYNLSSLHFNPRPTEPDACEQIAKGEVDARFRYLERIVERYRRADGLTATLPATIFHYARPNPDLELDEHTVVRRGLDHFGTTRGARARLLDVDGDGLLDRVTATEEDDGCLLRWNKGLFGGDMAGGSGFRLHRIDTDGFHSCTLSGAFSTWTPSSDGGPQVQIHEQLGFHFQDFDADGVVDLLTSAWRSSDSDLAPAQPAKPMQAGSRFVWHLYRDVGVAVKTRLESPPGAARDEDFPPSLPPPTSQVELDRSLRPLASIPRFADLDGDGELEFIDVGTAPSLLGDGKWRVSLSRRERSLGGEAYESSIDWPVPKVQLVRSQSGSTRGYILAGEGTQHQNRVLAASLQDINGDGLPDLVAQTRDRRLKAFLNYGRGFRNEALDLGLSTPLENLRTEFETPGFLRNGKRFFLRRMTDVDGDGLVDMLVLPDPASGRPPRVHFNLGDHFTPAFVLDRSWMRARRLIQAEDGTWALQTAYFDADGDGRGDLVRWQEDGPEGEGIMEILSEPLETAPRALVRVERDEALRIEYDYAPAANPQVVDLESDDPEPHQMPSDLWVVRSIRVTGGHGTPTSVQTYSYGNPAELPPSGRKGDPEPERFLGFREVTMTESGRNGGPARRIHRTYAYDEDGHPDGRVTEERSFHNEGDGWQAYRFTDTTWTSLSLFDDATFVVKPSSRVTRICPQPSADVPCPAPQHDRHRTWVWRPHEVEGEPVLWLRGAIIEPNRGGSTERQTSYQYEVRYGQQPFEDDDYRVLVTEKRIHRVDERPPGAESEPMGRVETHYNEAGLPVTEMRWQDSDTVTVTRRTYDDMGNVTSVTKPEQVVEASGDRTRYGYGPHRLFVRRTTNEEGHVVFERHDVTTGEVVERRGPSCVQVEGEEVCTRETWKRDTLGRVEEHRVPVDDPDEGYALALVERRFHLDRHEPSEVLIHRRLSFDRDAWMHTTRKYDGLGRLLLVERQRSGRDADGPGDAVDEVTQYHYDALGHVKRVEVPDPRVDDGSTVAYGYEHDGAGRLRRFRRPDGSGLDVAYDGRARTYTEVTEDGSGGSRTEIHDVFDRLVEVREHDPNAEDGVTRYAYDVNDNLTQITDADGTTTELEHDFLGNRLAVRRGDRVWRYEYDLNGNRVAKTEPVPEGAAEADFTTRYAYDDLDRLRRYTPASRGLSDERREALGIARITYRYDRGRNRTGRLHRVRMPYLEVAYEYNARGQITQQVRTANVDQPSEVKTTQTVARRYNALGKLTSSAWGDGQRWQITYDDRGQVDTVEWLDPRQGAMRKVADYRRSVAGPPRVRETDFGQRRDVRYDELGRPVHDAVSLHGDREPVAIRSYAYTDSGDLASVEGNTAGVSAEARYTYDARHRIVSAAAPNGYAGSFSYSPAGNVQTASVRWDGGASRDVTYDYGATDPQAVDRLADAGGGDHSRFGYDRAGHMTERTTPEGTWHFTWDGEGQLREADGPRGLEVYYYDHRGQRVLAVDDEGARLWFAESETHFDADGHQTRRYLRLSNGGATVARVENGESLELQYADALNNLMLSLDEGGGVTAGFLYGPFGEVVHATGADDHRRRFNGKEHDAATGLRYYGFRYYDPLTLRWNSADPLYRLNPEIGLKDPQRLNLYAFSNNNPVRYYDPDGREAKPMDFGKIISCFWDDQCGETGPEVGSGETDDSSEELSEYAGAEVAAAGGTLSLLNRWIQQNILGTVLAKYLDARSGAITENPRTGETEHRTRTEIVQKQKKTASQRPSGKRGGRSAGARGVLKASKSLGRAHVILNFLAGIFSDIGTYQRAQEAGRSFGEQIHRETWGKKMVIPGLWIEAEPGECLSSTTVCNPPGGGLF